MKNKNKNESSKKQELVTSETDVSQNVGAPTSGTDANQNAGTPTSGTDANQNAGTPTSGTDASQNAGTPTSGTDASQNIENIAFEKNDDFENPSFIDLTDTLANTIDKLPATTLPKTSKKRGFKILSIVLIIVLLITSTLALGTSIFTIIHLNNLSVILGNQLGMDINSLMNNGIVNPGHPIYDDAPVIAAYKSGDDSKLDEKDKYVYKKAKSILNEIIKDDMSDYDKELAVYNWIFDHTHYLDDNLVDVRNPENPPKDPGNAVIPYNGENGGKGTVNNENGGNAPVGNKNTSENNDSDNNVAEGKDTESPKKKAAIDEEQKDKIASKDPYGQGYSYEPYGVFKFGEAICVGKATTFKLFMGMLDIPCKIIHSTENGEHAWNLVKIEGDWYHVDVTFDSWDNRPSYIYFNVTDNVKMGSYSWDVTKFPAATAIKCNYAVKNSVNPSTIYDVPSMVRQAIDKGQEFMYIKASSENHIDQNAMDYITESLSSIYPNGFFYTEVLSLDEKNTFYILQLVTSNHEDPGKSDGENTAANIDYDKLNQIMDSAFSGLK